MSHFFFILALILITGAAFPQKSIRSSDTPSVKSESQRWTLDKYIWSYAQYKGEKNEKCLIDFNTIDNWQGMSDYLSISDNGKYFAYGIESGVGLPDNYRKLDSLIVQSTTGSWRRSFAGVQPGFFTADNKQYVMEKKDALCFLQVGTENYKVINSVESYRTTGGANKWMAYKLKSSDNLVVLHNILTGKDTEFRDATSYSFDVSKKWFLCQTNTRSKELLICNLESGKVQTFLSVKFYIFSPDGNRLLVNNGNELQYVNFTDQTISTIWTTKDTSKVSSAYQFDVSEKQLVFTVKYVSDGIPLNSIWYYKEGMNKAIPKVDRQTPGLNKDLQIESASFTDNGHYIQFSMRRKSKTPQPESDAVQLDVWSYKDSTMQSTQAYLLKQGRMYNAIIGTESDEVIQLEREGETLYLLHGDFAIIKKRGEDIHGDRFWESGYNHYEDSNWLVSLKDGNHRPLRTKGGEQTLWFSPKGNYLIYFDASKNCHYFSYDLRSQKLSDICPNIPEGQLGIVDTYLRTDKTNECFPPPNLAAWLQNDNGLLVYDNNDIWQLDLTGKKPAVNLTNGFGHSHSMIFSLMNSERYALGTPTVKEKVPLLLRAFDTKNKCNGIYRKVGVAAKDPELLSIGQYFMNIIKWCQDPNLSSQGMRPLKARNADVWIVQRQSATDAPNYFETTNFKSYRRLTNFQPQSRYNWAFEELHSFEHLDGTSGQGILYKPENFDSSKKYPVLIIVYGGYSNNLYQFSTPSYNYEAITPGVSPIWFLNNGYLVFTPDIYVSPLKYGTEAFNVIEGAVRHLKQLGYVDSNKLGCCAHSWSAKLGAYIFTHSKSFSGMAISEGMLYANMINTALSTDENGISNLERVENQWFQFGSFWKNKDSWLDQTTVLNVDKAISPLLLLCNKQSSKDYQNQTVQLFTALRRLDKKVWWLKYDKGDHNLSDLNEQKDYTIRYTQFFDHYLRHAPPAKWMTQGIPASLRGIEDRYDLDPSGSCGKECSICKKWNEHYKAHPEMFEKPISEWTLDNK